jgi:hypothetical protein
MRYTFTVVAAILALAFIMEFASTDSAQAAEGKRKPQVMDGWIRSVDLQAKSFVLGGRKASQTTFRGAVKVAGNREPAHVFLDG